MITIYSKTHCPYCVLAKDYLTNHNIGFDEINIENDAEAKDWILNQGHRSVPQFYVGSQLLVQGGYNGLIKMGPDAIKQRISEIGATYETNKG